MEQATGGEIKVSVIMPAFNHARWVRSAIESVLAQSLTALELIVIDDASTDASWETIQAVRTDHADTRLQCLRHASNQGAPATINEGLRHAQGEYLAIINSDDIWEPNRLERLLHVAETTRQDFLCSDVFLLDADSLPCETTEHHWVAWFENLKQDYASHADVLATLLRGNFLITTSNFLFHRRVYARVGEFADLRYVHDYDYALRVLVAGFGMRFLSGEKLLGYRLHGSNTIREQPLAAIEENTRLLLGWLPCLHEWLDEQRLQGLQFQLQSLYRYTGEEWQTTIHNRLVAKEQELFPLIADRDRWIAERDHSITGLQQHLQQQQGWLVERDQWISERDTIIRQQALALQEHAHWVAERDLWVAQRDGWIAERDQWIAERDALIRQLQQQQQQLRNSRAFRLGESLLAPLRYVQQLLRGNVLCLKN
ncbi:MAG TPA: glycosyltransferase [Candidatus Thiothrix moscowensis]|uniref:glycosyltransferase family 2 protein n=1 Tax=unclassified Thiothrix TaxID=2636184 RepID=UPI0025E9AF15|nr:MULTISPECIES: glycosyltransferase [unclassified Thiothrix]HRJ53786.1 glycosyltransferase [Candidatus Thiothrix moscowensis]HRJ93868.1 glycosyltransferase [Candidatus Thiothrix moscowensis]